MMREHKVHQKSLSFEKILTIQNQVQVKISQKKFFKFKLFLHTLRFDTILHCLVHLAGLEPERIEGNKIDQV